MLLALLPVSLLLLLVQLEVLGAPSELLPVQGLVQLGSVEPVGSPLRPVLLALLVLDVGKLEVGALRSVLVAWLALTAVSGPSRQRARSARTSAASASRRSPLHVEAVARLGMLQAEGVRDYVASMCFGCLDTVSSLHDEAGARLVVLQVEVTVYEHRVCLQSDCMIDRMSALSPPSMRGRWPG